MKRSSFLLSLALAVVLPSPLPAQSTTAMSSSATVITGRFDVKMTPQSAADAIVTRMTLDKKYHGPLEATGTGEMLAAMTAVKGSAGYTAIEKVAGKLAGREGTFYLQHSGIMDRGAPKLAITVIPDSGTGELTGLTGKMDIQIAVDGTHTYVFEYMLP